MVIEVEYIRQYGQLSGEMERLEVDQGKYPNRWKAGFEKIEGIGWCLAVKRLQYNDGTTEWEWRALPQHCLLDFGGIYDLEEYEDAIKLNVERITVDSHTLWSQCC